MVPWPAIIRFAVSTAAPRKRAFGTGIYKNSI